MQNSGIANLPLWVVMLVYVAMIFVIFYVVKLGTKKQQKRTRDMQDQVRRGDTICTIGGIVGKVTRRSADGTLTIEIDEKTGATMKIYLQAVSRILAKDLIDDDPAEKTGEQAGGKDAG